MIVPVQGSEVDLHLEGTGYGRGLLLFATALLFIPLARLTVDKIARRPSGPPAGWELVHVVMAVLVGLVVVAGAAFIPGQGVLSALVQTLVVVGAVALAAVLFAAREPGGLRALGLAPEGSLRATAAGLLAYLLLVPALLGVLFLWPQLARDLGIEITAQAVLTGIVELDGGALVLAGVLAVILQPLCEELVFRGFLQPVLVRRLGAVGGIVLTSLFFASLHGTSALLPIFALSLLLGWLRLRTGRLAAAWAAHGLHNGLVLALVLALQAG